MQQKQPDLNDRWIKHQRRNHQSTQSWVCVYCADGRIFISSDDLWNHVSSDHAEKLPSEGRKRDGYRKTFQSQCFSERPTKRDSQLRKPTCNEATIARTGPSTVLKKPLSNPGGPTKSLSELQAPHREPTCVERDQGVQVMDILEDKSTIGEHLRKRAAIGDGISTGAVAPLPFCDSESPLPRRSKARSTSALYGSASDTEARRSTAFEDPHRFQVGKKALWTPDQDSPLTRSSFNPPNNAIIQTQKSRNRLLEPKSRKAYPSPQGMNESRQPPSQVPLSSAQPAIFGTLPNQASQLMDEAFDIVMQPETRPISQEQLVAEVKGIYAGLVMVEAKRIEVDNKQAALASADPEAQLKLNNEQWQALIALHRTLLHEHHDFFLASQHTSGSPALRRLASKYAMPARMWRHGIYSLLELLRHRLPASLDHMLAFIYLAYSMMALLYETVPAFDDTWIECLGDLGRYRMAIEDDDITDREVWTGVARHWYSKVPDKTPVPGRLYHHLAILARPSALQQLFYYSKPLCVSIPFISARESTLTLFDRILSADSGQRQYRLPPLTAAFIKAHALLFTKRRIVDYGPKEQQFFDLLDNQIGIVTHKFMEQGYHIAIPNYLAMLRFASQGNVLMRVLKGDESYSIPGDVSMQGIFCAEQHFQDEWSTNENINGEEKYHERDKYAKLAYEYAAWLRYLSTKILLGENERMIVSKLLTASIDCVRRNNSLESANSDSNAQLRPELREDLRSCASESSFPTRKNETVSSSPARPGTSTATSKDQIRIPLREISYPSSVKVVLRGWTIRDSLRMGIDAGRKFLLMLNFLDSFFRVLVIFECFRTVRSWPIHNLPSHAEGSADRETDLRQESDLRDFLNFFKIIAECLVLLFNSHIISQKQSKAMRFFTGSSAFGLWYVGMDERVPDYELVAAWLSTAGLFYQHFSKQLEPFERTGAATGTFIAGTAVSLVEIIRRHSTPFEGRYASPLALHIGSVLPATVMAEWAWEAFVLKTGLAKCIEDAIADLPDAISRNFGLTSNITSTADGKGALIPISGPSNQSHEQASEALQVLQPRDKPSLSTYTDLNNSVQNEPVTAQNAHTILFVSTGPHGLWNLDVQKEKAELSEALALCNRPDMFRIVEADSIRPDTLGARLRRTKGLAIMHFAGHGNPNGDFVFQDKCGHIKIVDATALGDLLELAKKNGLQVAVLNNCYSDEKAQYIANKVGVTVAMKGVIRDAAAIAFASAFYGALGDSEKLNTKGVREAFQWAERELRMSFPESAGRPRLLLRQR